MCNHEASGIVAQDLMSELKKIAAAAAQEVYRKYALEVEPEEEPLLDDKIAPANFLDGLI